MPGIAVVTAGNHSKKTRASVWNAVHLMAGMDRANDPSSSAALRSGWDAGWPEASPANQSPDWMNINSSNHRKAEQRSPQHVNAGAPSGDRCIGTSRPEPLVRACIGIESVPGPIGIDRSDPLRFQEEVVQLAFGILATGKDLGR